MEELEKKTILLVEDEVILTMVVARTISSFGYEVVTADSGERAVEIALSNAEINLVLMDIDLGRGIDGPEAARQILDKRHLPIVFHTSHSEKSFVDKVKEITRYGYVIKNSGDFVLRSSLEMAFELFEANEVIQKKLAESKQAEAIIRASEDRFRAISEYSYNAICIVNDQAKIEWVNNKLLELSGYTYEQVMSANSFLDFLSDESKEFVIKNFYTMLSGEPYIHNYTFYIIRADGEKRLFEKHMTDYKDNLGKLKLIITMTDITERKQTEDALRESEIMLRTVYDNSPIGLEVYDRDGYLIRCNQKIWEMYDVAPEIVIGKMNLRDDPNYQSTEVWEKLEAGQEIRVESEFCFDFVTYKTSKTGTGYYDIITTPIPESVSTKVGYINQIIDITNHKSIEESLKESEAKFKSLIELAPDAILMGNPEGIVTSSNLKSNEITGYIPEELNGQSIKILFSEEEQKRVPLRYDLLKQGHTVHNERILTRKDKSTLFVEMMTKMMPDKTFLTIIRDISERKNVEWELQENRDRLKTIFDTSPDGMAICSLEGVIQSVTPRSVVMWGYGSQEEMLGKNIFEFLHPAYHEKAIYYVGEMFKGILTGVEEYLMVRKDGSTFYSEANANVLKDADNNPIGVMYIVRDISERKSAEQEIKESEEKYRVLTESMKDVIWIIDLETMHFTYVSPSVEKLRGYTPEEIISEPAECAFVEQDREKMRNVMIEGREKFLSGKVKADHFYTNAVEQPCKDGSTVWTEVIISYYLNEKTGHVEIRGVTRDITDRKLAEAKIDRLFLEKEILLQEVHHRIKNNMNTINSLLSLQAETLLEPSAIEALDDAASRVRSMAMLYDKLYQSTDYKEMSLKDYIPALVEQIIYNFPNSEIVKINLAIGDIILDAKKLSALGIIINELLTNIMKYAFIGRLDGLITVSATLKEEKVCIIVQDNGNGIPVNISFENSTGFGLMLVGMLSKQIKGTISIDRGIYTKIILEFAQ